MPISAPPRADGDEEGGYLKYILAASVFATAFGNIFVAKRMRMPKAPRGFTKYGEPVETSSSSSSSYTKMGKEEARQHFEREQERILKRAQEEFNRKVNSGVVSIPPSLIAHLEALDMPVNKFPTVQETKRAYRAAAMKYHPDHLSSSLSAGDPMRVTHESKFKACSQAYSQMLVIIGNEELIKGNGKGAGQK